MGRPSDARHVTVFHPNPVQRRFIESRARADLFASRVGEGKSTALAWCAFSQAVQAGQSGPADWVMVRDTYENIRRSTLKTFLEWFPPGVYGTYNKSDHEFKWNDEINPNGTVTFIGMDSAESASRLLSWELSGFGMDEPAPAVGSAGIDEFVFDLAMTRLRKAGMPFYSAKLATNNPDESHWTFQKFSDPGTPGFLLHQPDTPENVNNLPEGYYEQMRATLAHRPDLIRRFVDGKFGFQQEGRAVTPQFAEGIHLATGLAPLPRIKLHLLWDFGHNPTCIITQVTPQGYWLILEAHVGDGIGVEELIQGFVVPAIAQRYRRYELAHIGDPAGETGEQTSIHRSAVKAIKAALGGTWRPGPIKKFERIDPLQTVLSRTVNGRGIVQVDRFRAKEVWYALRGGWHYAVSRTGVVSTEPVKDIHSHPGDAMGYGAAILFPMGRKNKSGLIIPQQAGGYFGGGNPQSPWRIGPNVHGPLPKHGALLKS